MLQRVTHTRTFHAQKYSQEFSNVLSRRKEERRTDQHFSLHTADAQARLLISTRALTFEPRSRAFRPRVDNTTAVLFSRARHEKRSALKFSERSKRINFRALPVSPSIQTRTISLMIGSFSPMLTGTLRSDLWKGKGFAQKKTLRPGIRC